MPHSIAIISDFSGTLEVNGTPREDLGEFCEWLEQARIPLYIVTRSSYANVKHFLVQNGISLANIHIIADTRDKSQHGVDTTAYEHLIMMGDEIADLAMGRSHPQVSTIGFEDYDRKNLREHYQHILPLDAPLFLVQNMIASWKSQWYPIDQSVPETNRLYLQEIENILALYSEGKETEGKEANYRLLFAMPESDEKTCHTEIRDFCMDLYTWKDNPAYSDFENLSIDQIAERFQELKSKHQTS